MSFIRKRFRDHPVARIEKWIEELSQSKRGAESPNALEIHWDEVSKQMVRLMMTRKTFPAILKGFEKFYSEEEVQTQKPDLYKLYSAFRNSIFKPLFHENYELGLSRNKNENQGEKNENR